MKLTAHRGLSSLAPENTLSAFKKAIQFGCDSIELDVQLSADHIPVVFHDQTVNRCTNGQGKVSDLTWHELRLLDAGLWFSDEFEGEYIPSLAEVLSLAASKKININIELKTFPGCDIDLLCEKVALVIMESEIDDEQLLFSSFSTDALLCIAQSAPTIRRGQLWQTIPYDFLNILQQIDAYSVHCDYRFLTEQQAVKVKSAGFQLHCYTANFPELVKEHGNWGVDRIITDTPQNFVKSKALEPVLDI